MVKNVSIIINNGMNLEKLFSDIKEGFETNEKVRFIMDGRNSDVSRNTVVSFKKIFDKFKKEIDEKLIELLIVVSGNFKKYTLQTLINFFTIKKPVKVIEADDFKKLKF
jgi:hypothetical protein